MKHSLCAILFLLLLNGCITISPAYKLELKSGMGLPGKYHLIEKGQTLWRISKISGISLEELVRINNITDATQVSIGQKVFIPDKSKTAELYSQEQNGPSDFIWPVKGKIASGFDEKNYSAISKGITIRVPLDSDVVASRSGIVVFAHEQLRGYGKTVIVDHEDGFMTVYTVLSKILAKPGDSIKQGEPIAKVSTGLMYFEIRKNHQAQNPYYYLLQQ